MLPADGLAVAKVEVEEGTEVEEREVGHLCTPSGDPSDVDLNILCTLIDSTY